jgi:hypothetical protein
MTTATKYEKNIIALGLSETDAYNAISVKYKKQRYTFYTDGAGLNYFDENEEQETGHELFCKLVTKYQTVGLLQALINAGATIVPVKKIGGYKLYKIQGQYELWHGRMTSKNGYRAGYVSNPENMQVAIDAAEEEMRCLMAEAI